jgi:hypothetical protein
MVNPLEVAIIMTTAAKVDLCKERPTFFKAPRSPELVDLPEAGYLVVAGQGEPGGANFQLQIGAIFSVAYTIKMAAKRKGHDFKVPTFEASWWIRSEEGELPPEKWRWQLLLMLPDFVAEADVEQAKLDVASKKRDSSAIRFERIRQGRCVQILHVGPYATEDESIQKMTAFMVANALAPDGPHHEVYLSDPNRSKPEALRTILRQRVSEFVALDTVLTCPNAATRDAPPKDGDLMSEACQECPALLRQVGERGTVSFYCMVYHNRFRSPGAAVPLTARPPNKASWSRESGSPG